MRLIGAILLGFLSTAALAQPAQPPQPVLITPPPPATPPTPAPEAPPPATTLAPAPVVTPPIDPAEVKPAAPPANAKPSGPPRRARYDVAVIQAIDKVTAESLKFEAEIGKAVRFKNLILTVRACERSMPDEPVKDSIAYLTIDSQPRTSPGRPTPAARQVYKGWMYASSPGLHPLEHAVYDAWLIECRAKAPEAPAPRR